MFDPQDSDELPPPSYELSLEAFDQKTQSGIEASLQPQELLADLWEEWDEAKFEANARASVNAPASSSSSVPSVPPVTAQQYPKEKVPILPSPSPPPQEEPAVRPLRIVKKSQATAYNKAVEARSYQSNNLPPVPTSSSNQGASLFRSFSVLDESRRTPPPMFEPVGPNYDGPEYEETVMSYVPGDSRPSSPVSVLSTESYQPAAYTPQPQRADIRPIVAPPPPQPPRPQYQPAPKPMQPQPQRPQYPRRRVGFDPMSAYRTKPAFTPGIDPAYQNQKVDPSAFYKYVSSVTRYF